MQGDYYTTTEAAGLLGISVDTVTRMCRDGRIDGAIKPSTKLLIPIAEVDKYLVPVEQAAAVEAAALAHWSDQRKASGNYSRK